MNLKSSRFRQQCFSDFCGTMGHSIPEPLIHNKTCHLLLVQSIICPGPLGSKMTEKCYVVIYVVFFFFFHLNGKNLGDFCRISYEKTHTKSWTCFRYVKGSEKKKNSHTWFLHS